MDNNNKTDNLPIYNDKGEIREALESVRMSLRLIRAQADLGQYHIEEAIAEINRAIRENS